MAVSFLNIPMSADRVEYGREGPWVYAVEKTSATNAARTGSNAVMHTAWHPGGPGWHTA